MSFHAHALKFKFVTLITLTNIKLIHAVIVILENVLID